MNAIRVGVIGAGGRMGNAACDAVATAPGLELVAAVGRSAVGREVHGLTVASELRALADAHCEVVIDVSVATSSRVALPWLAMHGMHAVVGVTGFTPEDIDGFRSDFRGSNCVIVPNFAISAVLMMRFAEMAAPFFDTAEIIELHHDRKIDAPSGTAMATARRMAAASDDWAADPTEHEDPVGARGGAGPAGIRLHAVRMRGMMAHQEVVLGTQGQTLTIRQDSYDRTSFQPGMVVACERIADHPGLTIGLDALLGL